MERVRAALAGISGVPVTPYATDGAVDAALLATLIARLANEGIHNLIAAGNTGEFFALSMDEVRLVHRTTIAAAAGRSLVTAAVGRSLGDALDLQRDAIAAGADAIMGHQPTDPFAAPLAQVEYFLRLADASTVPFVAYVRSDRLGLSEFERLAAHGNIAGIKFATTNLMLLGQVIRATRDLPVVWVCGLAEGWALPFYAMGARGFTSGLVNVFPGLSLSIHAALEAGDFALARDLIAPIARFEEMRTAHGNGANVTVVKEAMSLLGTNVGKVRPPGLPELATPDRAVLRELVTALSS